MTDKTLDEHAEAVARVRRYWSVGLDGFTKADIDRVITAYDAEHKARVALHTISKHLIPIAVALKTALPFLKQAYPQIWSDDDD